MKIQQVEVIPLRAQLPRTFHGSGYAVTARLTVLVRIHTDDGLLGAAYSGDERRAQPELVRIIREELAPVVVGQELAQIERLWEKMFALSLQARDYRIFMRALSAVDTALWDGLAKLAGLPLYQLLGGYRDSVPVIAIAGYYKECFPSADHDPIWNGLLGAQAPMIDGQIRLPSGPGLGWVLDEELIQHYVVEHA
jgi:D-arabinonate dehydratase